MAMSRLLTAREVAEQLGVSTETVLRWTRRGELPAIRLPGGAIRFRRGRDRGAGSRKGRRPSEEKSPTPLAAAPWVSYLPSPTPNSEEIKMPPTQRGPAYRLGPSRWGLRYYDADGKRQRKSPFPSQERRARATTAT